MRTRDSHCFRTAIGDACGMGIRMRKSTYKRIFCGMLAALMVVTNSNVTTYAAQEDSASLQTQETVVTSQQSEESQSGAAGDTSSNAGGSQAPSSAAGTTENVGGEDTAAGDSQGTSTDSSQDTSAGSSQNTSTDGSQDSSTDSSESTDTSSTESSSKNNSAENLTEEEKKAAEEKEALEKAQQEKLEKEKAEQEKLEKEKLEKEKLEKEKAEKEAQESAPINLGTAQESSVSLAVSDFYMEDTDGAKHSVATEIAEEDGQSVEVFDFSQIDADLSGKGGFDLTFSCGRSTADREVKDSDYIEFSLPSCFADLSASTEDSDYECSIDGQKVTITLREIPEEGDVGGRIHFTYTISENVQTGEENSCLFSVQNGTGTRAYKVIFADTEAKAIDEEIGKFSIQGSIEFDETLDGVSWTTLVRQPEFDESIIRIEQVYTDSEGKKVTKTFTPQDGSSKGEFYLDMIHDGNGSGTFTVSNVPKKVKAEDGQIYEVTSYRVFMEPALPYYQYAENEGNTIDKSQFSDDKVTTVAVTAKLTLKSQTITLDPTIVPADETNTTTFPMTAVFSNSVLEGKETVTKNYRPVANAATKTTITVPVGISYTITQSSVEGYRFDGTYKTTAAKESAGETTTETTNSAKGTVKEGEDLTVTTTNYSQNQSVNFNVKWVDNNSSNRPTLTANNFKLQYKVEGSDAWIDLTADNCGDLQLTKVPGLDTSQAALGEYAYKGLPAVDKNGAAISYQVVTDQELNNYTSSYTDSTEEGTAAKRTFTFQEKEDFHATIYWNDASNKENRPDENSVLNSLRLYRRVGNSYELVNNVGMGTLFDLSGVTVSKDVSGENWTIDITGLPRYNDDNQEYDYVLVHGTISDDGSISHSQVSDQYITYYDNGSGNYGNDIALCHNNGTITEVLNKKTEAFKATKKWKDPTGKSTTRPTATVTLWRYRACDADSIDDAFEKGKASQVVFKSSSDAVSSTEKIATYNLDTDKNEENIAFTSETVTSMPEGYELPAYDDQGHEYVYFVRETLSGTNASGYEIRYTDSEGNTCKYGAPTEGTITNVRRKKEEVHVTKVWMNPSGTGSIDDVTVRVQIQASADDGDTYDELPVLSDTQNSYDKLSEAAAKTAQTITGFSSTVSHGEVSYYVNTYDSEGRRYDMDKAKLVETVTDTDGKEWTVTTDDAGNTTIKDSEGNEYAVETTNNGRVFKGDGTWQYRYTQTNTITAKREYTLTKQWAGSIADQDLAQIESINFKLERRSTKETDSEYETVNPAEGDYWQISVEKKNVEQESEQESTSATFVKEKDYSLKIQNLPKYDKEGYEYYYRATEVSFVTKDGETITNEVVPAKKWSSTYYRSTEGTRVVNYVSTEGGRGFITFNKIWQDNGEEENRGDVTVRVYLREQLKEALSNAGSEEDTENPFVDLDSLQYNGSSLKYKKITLQKKDQYTSYLNYADIDKAILSEEEAEQSNRGMKDYIILEISADSNDSDAVAPRYTYEQLNEAASGTENYKITGYMEDSDRMYIATVTANVSEGLALLTNTRAGEASINVTKIWEDDKNANSERPGSVQFQLYRNGDEYEDILETVEVQAEKTDSTSAEDDESGGTTQENSCKVKLDRELGRITVTAADTDTDNTAQKWLFTITGLDMFDAAGEPYVYSIEEEVNGTDTIGGSGTTTYTSKKTVSPIEDTGKERTYKVQFTNTAYGTTSHFAYKYWKDAGIGADNRPDLRIEVYRYLRDDQEKSPETAVEKLTSYEKYADHKDPVWTEYSVTDSDMTERESDYNWKITVEDLPQYNEKGEAYVYVFKETMSNNGETVLGTYESKAETKQLDEGGTYEVFTNTITGTMNLRGKKIWKGLDGYTEGDLPDPVITLYRTTDLEVTTKDLQIMTENEINELINSGKLTKIDTTHLTGSTEGSNDKTIYNFPDTSDDSAETIAADVEKGYLCEVETGGTPFYKLPKFDAEGNRYTYMVRESFEGSEESNQVAGQLYISKNDNGTITNEFKSNINLRSITVTKKWNRAALEALEESIKTGENKFPSVTYQLFRYEIGNETATTKQIAQHTISAAEFANQYNKNGNAEVSYTFEGLRIFSPAGKQYGYYITENAISGYTISYEDETVGTETGENEEDGGKTDGEADGEEENAEEINTADEDLKNNDRCDVTSLPSNWNEENAQINTAVSTTNSYNQAGIVTLSGSKKWNDYANLEGIRPESITVTLTRKTDSESGQSNQVTTTKVDLETKTAEDQTDTTKPYIVWNYGDNKDTAAEWSYKIDNLPRYAANGRPYTYVLSEEQVTGYKNASAVSVNVNSGTAMPAMTNQFDGSYYVRKNWSDGYNKYNLRPEEITVKLQRSTDGGNTWNDIVVNDDQIGQYNETTGTWSGGLPSVSTNSEGKQIVSVNLTGKNVIANTKNASWGYQFTNLPTKDKNDKAYTYRCIETAIGGVPTEPAEEDSSDLLHCKAGAYECTTDVSEDGTKTTLTNTLSATSLVVTKKWEDDSEDLYQSRPDQLTFILQKKTYTPADEVAIASESGEEGTEDASSTAGGWENVTDVSGKVYTFTISKTEGWTKTLEDLPTAEVKWVQSEDGSSHTHQSYSLYYRAMEVHTGATYDANGSLLTNGTGDPLTPEGAKNYKDITDYSGDDAEGEGKVHYYNTTLSRNESTITNKLIKDAPIKSVSATKKWVNTVDDSTSAATPAATATFELLYKTTDEASWHCYGGKDIPSDGKNWSSHTTSASGTDDTGKSCKLKTVSSTAGENDLTVTWNDLPMYDQSGKVLEYKIVEHPVTGYVTEEGDTTTNDTTGNISTTFTNIESQSYTVKKIWQNASEAEKDSSGKFTAIFKLQRKVEGQDTDGAAGDGWTDVTAEQVPGYKDITLSTKTANDISKNDTWKDLPKYTAEGKQITYRAVETKINGIAVYSKDSTYTNGAYMVSYQYGTGAATDEPGKSPEFGDTQTTVTNRMIYGFVNLSKKAAYLAPSITSSGEGSLSGVTFKILKKNAKTGNFEDYVTNVTTDTNGNLQNKQGKYGKEEKYLVAGTYKLQETEAPSGFTVWKNGVTFKVGTGETTLLADLVGGSTLKDTGEHGTAWISTTQIGSFVLKLKAAYVVSSSNAGAHTIGDSCSAQSSDGSALDLESRGVVTFTKTGEKKQDNTYETLDYNKDESGKGNTAYFGIYTDQECSPDKQVAGMISKDPTGTDAAKMILTNKKQNGTPTLNVNDANGLPYLRVFGASVSTGGTGSVDTTGDAANTGNSAAGDSNTATAGSAAGAADYTDYPFTLLSGIYYIKELTAPAGYLLDTTVRKLVVKTLDPVDVTEQTEDSEEGDTEEGTNLSDLYVNNKAQIMDVSANEGLTDYSWSNTPNQVTLTKTDADSNEKLNGVVYTFSRTDVPKDESGNDLTEYFLKTSIDVTTGKSYKATRSADGTWSLTEITGADANVQSGQICIKGLPNGSYKLTEKTELSGYVLDDSQSGSQSSGQSSGQTEKAHEFTFTIDGSETSAQASVNNRTFNDINTKNQVIFCKTNTVDTEAGVSQTKGLAGAEFVVYEDDGNGNYKLGVDGNPIAVEFYASANQKASEKTSKVTTGADGKVTIYGLPTANAAAAGSSESASASAGSTASTTKTYHLVEVKAPNGYQLQTSSVVFTIDRQGKVQVKNASGTLEQVSDKTVTMADTPIKLYIQKFGESDEVKGKGAKFTLTDTCRTDGDTTGVASCTHKLADGQRSKTLEVTAEDGKLMLPTESIIAGHTYKLQETQAATGYQADAVVVFHVAEDGSKIDSIVSTTGGYLIQDNKCAVLDDSKTTIKIYDKRVGITLTKKDKETNTVLVGAEFTLKPYASSSGSGGSVADSAFGTGYSQSEAGSSKYDASSNTWTFTTDSNGQFTIPGGLLLHNRSYLLQETKAVDKYYLGKELKDGVILTVDATGKVTLSRLSSYTGGGTGTGDCPITLTNNEAQNTQALTAVNTQSSSFTLTKTVEGNMGDLNGTFEIKLSVYEPGDVQNETTLIAEKTIRLKAEETYDSVTGQITKAGSSTGSAGSDGASGNANDLAFGKDAIPKGATLIIRETGDYAATVKILDASGNTTKTFTPAEDAQGEAKGMIKLTLETAGQVIIELTNAKEAAIDVGVVNEKQAPLAAAALLIPAAWLFYRYRRRRRKY